MTKLIHNTTENRANEWRFAVELRILRKIQAHCDIEESTGINCSSSETVKQLWDARQQNNHAHTLLLSHTLFLLLFFFFTRLAELCSAA